jgi:hypothetical protein
MTRASILLVLGAVFCARIADAGSSPSLRAGMHSDGVLAAGQGKGSQSAGLHGHVFGDPTKDEGHDASKSEDVVSEDEMSKYGSYGSEIISGINDPKSVKSKYGPTDAGVKKAKWEGGIDERSAANQRIPNFFTASGLDAFQTGDEQNAAAAATGTISTVGRGTYGCNIYSSSDDCEWEREVDQLEAGGCHSAPYCEYNYKFGDVTMSESCRITEKCAAKVKKLEAEQLARNRAGLDDF